MSRSISFADNSAWVIYVAHDNLDYGWHHPALDDFTEEMVARFPSLRPCNRWIEREDRAFLENGHGVIGISEYMGLATIWCVPTDDDREYFHDHWFQSIRGRVETIAAQVGFTLLTKIGAASNGEAFFKKREPMNGS